MATNNEYQAQLEVERNRVLKELADLGVPNPQTDHDWLPTPADNDDFVPDPNDRGDRSEDWQARRGTLDALETRLNNLNLALEKISQNAFGRCELCDRQIEPDRLIANPAARTCMEHINRESDLTN